MTVISESVKDIAGLADNTKVVFHTNLPRENAAGDGIITPRRVTVTPTNGVLTTPSLDPGPAKVFYGVSSFDIVIPASGPVRLWPLIEQYIPVDGPQVSKAVAAAIDAVAAKNAAEAILDQVEAGVVPNSAVAAAVVTGPTKAALDQSYAPIGAAGVNPNDVGYDVILVAGQSNAVGYGTSFDAILDTADPRVFQWPGSGAYMGQIVAANDPLLHHQVASASIGNAMAFARYYARTIPLNRNVLLVPVAHGGTGFTTSSAGSPPSGYYYNVGGSWDPANGSGGLSLYDYAIAQANAAMATDPNNRLVGIVWIQGEADRGNLTQSQYAAKLDALIDGFRAGITGASAVTPFIVGQMLPELIASTVQAQNINAAHVDTPRRKTSTSFFYGSPGYDRGDLLHYSAAGQRVLGKRVHPALLRARANIPGTAPTVPTGLTLRQVGTSVIAAWDQPPVRATNFVLESSTNDGTTWSPLTRAQALDISNNTITGLTLGGTVRVRVSTVNEQGTSAPCTPVALTLVNAPGQPTGLSNGAMTAYTAPLTWTAPIGGTAIIDYSVEYKLHSSSTWLPGPVVSGLSATVSGLSSVSSYDFRVSARNAGGGGTPSATLTVSTDNVAPLRAEVGVPFSAAYSVRRLDSTYAGPALRARRSSDSTEQDIGFVSGELDTAALLTFCGAGDGFLTKWYDQSGNAKDLAQTVAANQPKIVAAGALNMAGTHAAALFDGSNDSMLTASAIGAYAAGASTLLTVIKAVSTDFSVIAAEGSTTTGENSSYLALYQSSGKQAVRVYDTANAIRLTAVGAGVGPWDNALHQQSIVDSGSSIAAWVDTAVGMASTSVTRAGTVSGINSFGLGGRLRANSFGSFFPGNIAEFVVFNAALTTGQRNSGEANQKAYYGTP